MIYTFIKGLLRRKRRVSNPEGQRQATLRERLQPSLPIVLYDKNKVGNTTRIVDYLIQRLFIDGEVRVYDHRLDVNNTRRVYDIILKRLEIEHPYIKVVSSPTNRVIVLAEKADEKMNENRYKS